MEKWMPINNFPKYNVSNKGNVKNIITGRILKPRKGHKYPNVCLYNGEGKFDKNIHRIETGEVYESIRECARSINGSEGHISKCLNGIYKQYRGLHFEYVY